MEFSFKLPYNSKYILIPVVISSLNQWMFGSVLLNFQIIGVFIQITIQFKIYSNSCCDFFFEPMDVWECVVKFPNNWSFHDCFWFIVSFWWLHIFYMTSILSNLLRLAWWLYIWIIMENAVENNLYFALVGVSYKHSVMMVDSVV